MRALVVDDMDETRLTLAQLFRLEGLEVEQAADGAQAVEVFGKAIKEGRPFDLVALDLAMPGTDGGTAAKMMRDLEGAERAWIEGYTGHPEEIEEVQSFMRAGLSHLTIKPGTMEGWKSLIQSLVRMRAN